MFGVVPAHQRLRPGHRARAQIDDRLVMQDKLVAADHAAQVLLQGETLARFGEALGGEEADGLPRVGASGHGHDGPGEQLAGRAAVLGENRSPDRHLGRQGKLAIGQLLAQHIGQGVQLGEGAGRVRGAGAPDGEGVAIDLGQGARGGQRAPQPLGEGGQGPVGRTLVEGGQPVVVGEAQRRQDGRVLRVRHVLRHAGEEGLAGRKAGDRMLVGEAVFDALDAGGDLQGVGQHAASVGGVGAGDISRRGQTQDLMAQALQHGGEHAEGANQIGDQGHGDQAAEQGRPEVGGLWPGGDQQGGRGQGGGGDAAADQLEREPSGPGGGPGPGHGLQHGRSADPQSLSRPSCASRC